MNKFYKITIICIITGLVLMGVGAAMLLLGINSFTYIGNKNTDDGEMLTKSIEFQLPDNLAKIYKDAYGQFLNLVIDESLEGNNAVLEVTYSSKEEVEVTYTFKDNYYLYNRYTENFSKYPVNNFNVYLDREPVKHKSGFELFKEIMSDFKEKKIYNYNEYGSKPKLILRVSKDGYERFAEVPEGYELYSYSGYMEEMKNREEEKKARQEAIREQYDLEDNDNSYSGLTEAEEYGDNEDILSDD